MEFGYTERALCSFDEAVLRTKQALADEGFGVLTEIDVSATFKEKMDVDFDSYLILGVCHPPSALKVLQADRLLGLMLPCNVVVYRQDDQVYVSTILPSSMLQMIDNSDVMDVAADAEVKLIRAVKHVNT